MNTKLIAGGLMVLLAAHVALAQPRGDRSKIVERIKSSDKNKDDKVTKDELPDPFQRHFDRMDANGDGAIDEAELKKLAERFNRGGRPQPNPAQQREFAEKAAAELLKQLDKNEDGLLDETELSPGLQRSLARLDTDKDSKLSKEELTKLRGRAGRAGEIITGAAPGERFDDTLKVGDAAPGFTLTDPSGKHEVTLSSFQAKRPVVLIFGSYT